MSDIFRTAPLQDLPVARQSTEAASLTASKVLVYGMNYAPEMAGVGRYTGEIADHLASLGVDVTVVTTPPHYPGWKVQQSHGNRYSRKQEERVLVYRVPLLLREKMGGIWRLLAPASFALTSAPVVFWQIVKRRPATVFCVEPTLFAAPVAQFAAWLVGARTVLHVQDLEVDAAFAVGHLAGFKWLKAIGHAFERMTLRKFEKVITISNRMAEKLTEKGVSSDRVAIVRNWVDLSHIYPMNGASSYRAEFGFSDEDFVVLYSGNIGAKQGLNILLEAAERLADEKRIHFVIAGEGPNKAELKARYGHLGNVRFLPFQPYARLNAFLNMPDLHVLPQEPDAADLVLPSKLGGMLASGRRVLVTANENTELAEFLGEASILIAPGNAELMAARIRSARDEVDSSYSMRIERAAHLAKDVGMASLVANLT
ncbi:colanic acid biosynthesis glycosyltransferase WcaI [Rhizobium sp. KAs_5_22]|uniref:WcaI family glycosyltransferase n=1 Tax=Ciceribacter selenitireducens TaxID=448181 RepID=UPI0004AD3398|nr:WcaI family glycosyltransferase [Ciceribacter selenitireducens]PPJ49399.1 colanic acid biosynthesis glycosyltransferase WcaI [Rhizobium sp. KAs_5_22]